MKSISLDSMRDKLSEKYEALEVPTDKETFVLRPVLRCTKPERDVVFAKLDELAKTDEDENIPSTDKIESVMDIAKEVITVVTANKRGKALVALLGDDMLLTMEVLSQWQEATQPGEASSSQD